MNHTDILNHLAQKHGLISYLEIGVQNPANNFDKIVCPEKVGVDPETDHPNVMKGTSDEFFEKFGQTTMAPVFTNSMFDLIFIDGLHHAEQVKKDFENSLKRLNPGGFIVIHDCNPTEEAWTVRPRGEQKMWTGDVWKFAVQLNVHVDVEFHVIDTDFGCAVVRKRESKEFPVNIKTTTELVTWEYFNKNREWLLNLITEEQFKEMY